MRKRRKAIETSGDSVNNLMSTWIRFSQSVAKLTFDSQQVIGLRLLRLAAGGPAAEVESRRMVAEKLASIVEAQIRMAGEIATGRGHLAPARALAVFQRKVSANRRRLS